ncbi:MAG: autotransporter assembly complex protein TamA [Comamonas sp.]
MLCCPHTPAPRPAFLLAAVMALALAGCGSFSRSGSTDDQTEAGHKTDALAFDLEVKSEDDAVRKYLEQHLELQRFRRLPGLQTTELTRLLGAANDDIATLMGTLGYFNPTVAIDVRDVPATGNGEGSTTTTANAATSDTALRPLVTITVEPGPQTRVGEVQLDYTGAVATDANAEQRLARLRRNWGLQTGSGFTQNGWDDAKNQGLRGLKARRYPTASIAHSQADIDADANTAKLGVRYDSGPLYRFGELRIAGSERYDPDGARRIARLPAGAIYSEADLLDTQARLAASGYYDSVFLTLDTEHASGDADAVTAPVIAQVREAKYQKWVFGVGISTDSGPRLSISHIHNQMPLLGWRAVSKLSLDRDNKLLSTEWTDLPRENGWRWFVGGQASRELTGDYTVNSARLRGGQSKSSDHIDRSSYLQYDFASTKGLDSEPASSALSANYAWTGRYFNNKNNPTRGYGLAAEVGAGVTLTPRRDPFLRLLARWQGFVPMDRVTAPNGSSRSSRLALRAEAGAVLAKASANIPVTQMFITGGDTTVRGYGYRKIGTRVEGDRVFGGRYMAVGSVEYQRPLVRGGEISDWESAVFVDAGSVADTIGAMTPYVGVGTGLRWRSPVGSLQTDVAYGLKDKRFRLHLRMGYTF